MRLLSSILIFFGFLIITSCEMINPEEQVPTYLHIDSFNFQKTPNTGTASQNITSVWVYFEGERVGVFDLPATVPILADAVGKVSVLPGVTYSGIKDILTPYVFFLSDTMTLTPAPGQIVSWTPTTQYMEEEYLNIFNVDFEAGGNPFTQFDGDTSLQVVTDPNLVFEGNASGYIYLDNMSRSENMLLQQFFADKEAYIELNYRGTLDFEVGLQSTTAGGQPFTQYVFGYKARPDWNKVYIGLQDFISANPGKAYRVVIKVAPGSPSTGFVLIDNLKVIFRK